MKKSITKIAVMAAFTTILAFGGLTGCGNSSKDEKSTDNKKTETTQETEAASTDEKKNQDLIPVRLGVGGQGNTYSMELANLAYKNGYLEDELKQAGYELQLQAFVQTGPEVNTALASGDLDGAIYGDFPLFTSNSSGIKSTLIATVNQKVQYGILTVKDDIKEPKDLEGKRVIVGQGTVIQYFWEHYVKQNDIDASKVEIVNATDAASLLQTGEADAYVSIMTAAKYMESLGLGKVFDDGSDVEGGSTVGVVTLRNDFLEQNPQVAVAINKALIKAYGDAQADPDSFYNALATEQMTAEVLKTGYENDPSLTQLNPQITNEVITHLKDLNDWLVENQLIGSPVDVDQLYDTTYYDQAEKELGK